MRPCARDVGDVVLVGTDLGACDVLQGARVRHVIHVAVREHDAPHVPWWHASALYRGQQAPYGAGWTRIDHRRRRPTDEVGVAHARDLKAVNAGPYFHG